MKHVSKLWILTGLSALLAAPASLRAQDAAAADGLKPIRDLEGTWEGRIDGILGQGTGIRSYEPILDGHFVVERHSSIRLPQEKSPQGDRHREIGIYSWDAEREAIVLRSFFVEGFVARSLCEPAGTKLVCTSEAIEGGSGMKSRLTLEWVDPFRFVEIFELASPGQELSTYFRNEWTRVPELDDVTSR